MADVTRRMVCSPPPSRSSERVVSPEEDTSEVVNPSIDHFESNILDPSGMRRYPRNSKRHCIYRVPDRLRQVNPKAYTPQLVIIGPLHLSLKAQALKSLRDDENPKFMGYLNMEEHKKFYLTDLVRRLGDENISNEFINTIKENEEKIRASYSEPIRIQSHEFVEMILHDSVFILECFLKLVDHITGQSICKETEEDDIVLMDETITALTVRDDLILLENQLPYFILQTLFDPIVTKLFPHKFQTFRELIIECFEFQGKIDDKTDFKHFTDLFRCVHVKTLRLGEEEEDGDLLKYYGAIEYMYSVEQLENAGVNFEAIDETGLSLEVRFEKGCLKLPCFYVDDFAERILRNIMALEQCHYPYQAYVCSFAIFLDFLIGTHKDVDILVRKGIIETTRMGDLGSVVEMVNKLPLGVVEYGFNFYTDVATKVRAYCHSPLSLSNRSQLVLKRVIAAAEVILLLTIIQTIVSIVQVMQK